MWTVWRPESTASQPEVRVSDLRQWAKYDMFHYRPMETKKPNETRNAALLAVTQTAVGCGLGLLLGGKLSSSARKTTAFSLLGIGALLAVPSIVEAVGELIAGPETERGAKKSLDSIRQDSGLPEDAEAF